MLENVESIVTVGQCMANYFEMKFVGSFVVVMLMNLGLNTGCHWKDKVVVAVECHFYAVVCLSMKNEQPVKMFLKCLEAHFLNRVAKIHDIFEHS